MSKELMINIKEKIFAKISNLITILIKFFKFYGVQSLVIKLEEAHLSILFLDWYFFIKVFMEKILSNF